jgi:hypothetical protein
LPIESNPDMPYIFDMNNFLKGVSSVGQLFPDPSSYSDYPSKISAWQSVANSFYQAGKNLHVAMKEVSNAQRENKQTP